MQDSWYTIINPNAGSGRANKDWPKIEEELKRSRFEFRPIKTEHPRHSEELVQRAIKEGYRKILCIGGDGTLHNIVNGILKQNSVPSTEITLAHISVGTGNDWVRTYGIPKGYKENIRSIKLGQPFIQDAGIARFEDGKESRFFLNLCGIGFDGEVVKQTGKKLGKISYMLGSLKALLTYNSSQFEIQMDQEEVSGKHYMVLAGIGQYGGGGMRLVPDAITNDGYFDLTLAGNLGKWEIISRLGQLYSGKFVEHPKVQQAKAQRVKVKAARKKQVYMEADGELMGTGDFEMEVIPAALRVLVPSHNFKD